MDEFILYLKIEVKKIEIDKWIEGIKKNCDPGDEYVSLWVEHNAENFRFAWDRSKCKTCSNCNDCGYNLLSACDGYEKI